jgi:hypothetical protein
VARAALAARALLHVEELPAQPVCRQTRPALRHAHCAAPAAPRLPAQELLPSNPLLSRDAVALSSLRALTSLELYLDDATTTYYHRRPQGYSAPDPDDALPAGLMPLLVLPGNRLREAEYSQRVWPAWCSMRKVRLRTRVRACVRGRAAAGGRACWRARACA